MNKWWCIKKDKNTASSKTLCNATTQLFVNSNIFLYWLFLQLRNIGKLSDYNNPSTVHLPFIYFDELYCKLRWFLCLLVIISLFFMHSPICMQCVLQSTFLQALSNQSLCIICLNDTGCMPSAWCYHGADKASWHCHLYFGTSLRLQSLKLHHNPLALQL